MVPTLLLLSLAAFCTTVTPAKVCGRPRFSDGVDISSLKRVFEVGEEVTLSCEQGYLPSTASLPRITCTAAGEWTSANLACSRELKLQCLPEQNVHYSLTITTVDCYRNIFSFIRYVMVGANESRCLHDGTWSNPPPVCKGVSCPLPRPPREGRIAYDKPATGTETIYGQGWTYECNPPKAPTYERGSCMADGRATEPPVCREVSCPIPPSIPNGVITFAIMRQHGYKEKVKYSCNEHYTLEGEAEIQCQNTGTWSSLPACRAPCTVGIKRGRIFYNGRKMWIEDLKPNRVLHKEPVVFYCKNKVDKCGYPVASTCNDGNLPIPDCFEEPGKIEYNLRSKNLPSEIRTCAALPATNPTSSPRPS
uniref:Beta-2-glycoprotein 1 n=1 Tax=Cyprinodon variegatus TaxID=28743 RepID=A0A3Q2GH36_CYPVA